MGFFLGSFSFTHRKPSTHLFAEEGEINFAPTYRYERGTRDTYKWEKQKATHVKINVPSWCDRVLWKSFANASLHQTSYGCATNIVTSDHSPVFATFRLLISNQYVSSNPTQG